MKPLIIAEHEQRVSEVLIENNLGDLIDHLSDGSVVRDRIRLKEQELRAEKHKLPRELVWIYNAYPSNKQVFKELHGMSKRMSDRVERVRQSAGGPTMISLEEGLRVVRQDTKERKKHELKAKQEKHREARAGRSGKVRTKFVKAPSGKEKK